MAPKTARVLFSSIVVVSLGVVCAPGVGAEPELPPVLSPLSSPAAGGARVGGAVPPQFIEVVGGSTAGFGLDEDGNVWAWGANFLGNGTYDRSSSPVRVQASSGTLPPFTAIAACSNTGYALDKDGNVWAWGYNQRGELGNGTTTDSLWPVRVRASSGTLPPFTAIAAGGASGYALDKDGNVWAWGDNNSGELGNGTTTNSPWPVRVRASSGTLPPFTAIAAGNRNGYALDENGNVWAWGYNNSGQLGNGTTTNSPWPVRVQASSGTLPPFAAIAAGSSTGYALDRDGGIWDWGDNYYGQLGNGTTTHSSWPVRVQGTLPPSTAIAAGDSAAYALDEAGSIRAWGANNRGQLGNGTKTDSRWPVQVQASSGTLPPFTAVTGGHEMAFALDEDGRVWSWGDNVFGGLGNGTTDDSMRPGLVSATVRGVTFGGVAGTGLSSSGGVWSATTPAGCGRVPVVVTYGFGLGQDHQAVIDDFRFGNPPTISTVPPSGVVVTGGVFTTSVVATGDPAPSVKWQSRAGAGGWADVPGATGSTLTVRPLVDTSYRAVATSCWSTSTSNTATSAVASVVVRSSSPSASAPVAVSPSSAAAGASVEVSGVVPPRFTAIAKGASMGYALDEEGRVWAWGRNAEGQLGNGTTVNSSWPVLVRPGTGMLPRFTAIAAGGSSGYALDEDGHMWAWGNNGDGQLGVGTTTRSLWPVRVQTDYGVLPSFTAIGAGSNAGYAIDESGRIWAWGVNGYGQLGDGTTTGSLWPVLVKAVGSEVLPSFTAVAGGSVMGYALAEDGAVWAWGRNGYGELGIGTFSDSLGPVRMQSDSETLPAFTAIAAGSFTGYALGVDGSIRTWGLNSSGQLGIGTTANSPWPVRVQSNSETLPAFTAIIAGDGTGYALDGDGKVRAWGYNDSSGLLGNGTTTRSLWPVLVQAAFSGELPPFTTIAAGGSTGHALDEDGHLWSWGSYLNGQLGSGATTHSLWPALVLPTARGVSFGGLAGGDLFSGGGRWVATAPAGCGQVPVTLTFSFGEEADPASATGVFGFGAPPVITAQPTSGTVAAGGTFTTMVGVAGDPLPAVKWQSRTGTGNWTDVPGASGTALTDRPLVTTDYRAVATNCWSTPASFTVYSTPASVIVRSPSSSPSSSPSVPVSPQFAKTVTMAMKKLTMTKNTTLKAVWLAYPASAKTTLTWSSSRPKVAKVSASGKITALKPGRAVITAKTNNGKLARLKVTVVSKAVETKAVKAAKTSMIKLKKGKTTRLTVAPSPPGATLKKMPTFKSTKPKIASVDKTGLVTAKKKGKTKLTVTLAGKKTTLTIHVK